MASAKVNKVKKSTASSCKKMEGEDGKKLEDYEILSTIGRLVYIVYIHIVYMCCATRATWACTVPILAVGLLVKTYLVSSLQDPT